MVLACVAVSQSQSKQTMIRLEGNNVTLITGITGQLESGDQVLWMYGPVYPEIKILQVYVGKPRKPSAVQTPVKFRGRLQLDEQSGSLTISNLSVNDTGVYKLQVINSHLSSYTFNVDIYGKDLMCL